MDCKENSRFSTFLLNIFKCRLSNFSLLCIFPIVLCNHWFPYGIKINVDFKLAHGAYSITVDICSATIFANVWLLLPAGSRNLLSSWIMSKCICTMLKPLTYRIQCFCGCIILLLVFIHISIFPQILPGMFFLSFQNL